MGMFGSNTKKFIGIAGDALLGLAGKPGVYGPAMAEQRQQQSEYQRQLQIAQFKAQNPEPTAVQRNYEYFGKLNRPDLQASYLNAEANPQVLGTDPSTGALGFFPKGGMPAASPAPAATGGPAVKVIGGKQYYQINGEWYDNPEGR